MPDDGNGKMLTREMEAEVEDEEHRRTRKEDFKVILRNIRRIDRDVGGRDDEQKGKTNLEGEERGGVQAGGQKL